MKLKLLASLLALSSVSAQADISFSGAYKTAPITLTSCDNFAGGICKVVFRGKNYTVANDHGQGWQSASSFNGLREAYNPTEQGSSFFDDGFADQPSKYAKLLYRRVSGNTLITDSRMAFWRPVWDKIDPYKRTLTSDHYLTKTVTIGAHGLDNVIHFNIRFDVPVRDLIPLTVGQFEVLTTYLPEDFSLFFTQDKNGNVAYLSDQAGEQSKPIVFSTSDYQHAVALYSPDAPQKEYPEAGFGRWRFENCCTKINYVMRVANPSGLYSFRAYVIIGTFAEVSDTLATLRKKVER